MSKFKWRFWRKEKPSGAPPESPTAPTICSNGYDLWVASSWWKNEPSSHAYQWYRYANSAAIAIAGATGCQYKLTRSEREFGGEFECVVAAANLHGTTFAASNRLQVLPRAVSPSKQMAG